METDRSQNGLISKYQIMNIPTSNDTNNYIVISIIFIIISILCGLICFIAGSGLGGTYCYNKAKKESQINNKSNYESL